MRTEESASHSVLHDIFLPQRWPDLAERVSARLLGTSGDERAAGVRAPGARETEQARKLRLWFTARNRGEI